MAESNVGLKNFVYKLCDFKNSFLKKTAAYKQGVNDARKMLEFYQILQKGGTLPEITSAYQTLKTLNFETSIKCFINPFYLLGFMAVDLREVRRTLDSVLLID
ncbi:MAG: hypothetical protein QXP53_02305 [Candidatus Pacearchaeota archaeon]